jgi:methylmalonyl-CoA/ethylmalonyl-CoA epimerase
MGLKWMFHATAMAPSYDAVLAPLRDLLGCRVLHDQVIDTPGIERRGGMTWIADNSIEIGEPHGDGSPVWRFIDRFGGGMHSVAVQVDDLDQALERAAALGVRVADRPLPGVAFTRPSDTAGLLFEWNHNPQRDDPRWGATLPPTVRSVLDPDRFAYVGAVVTDPVETARRLADLFGTESTVLSGRGRPDAPWASVAIGDCSIALFPCPEPDEATATWGMRCDRPRFVTMAITTPGAEEARRALVAAGYRVSATLADGSLVLYGQGLPFPLVVTTDLLPGDPRLSSSSEGPPG